MGCNGTSRLHSLQRPNERYATETGQGHVPQIIDEGPQNRLLRKGAFHQAVDAPRSFSRAIRVSQSLCELSQSLLEVMRGGYEVATQFSAMELFMPSQDGIDDRYPYAASDVSQQIEEATS